MAEILQDADIDAIELNVSCLMLRKAELPLETHVQDFRGDKKSKDYCKSRL